MFPNINNIFNMYTQMASNPIQFLSQRFNIPQGMNSPTDIIQHLLNTGQVSQAQVNNAMNMRNNPMIQNMLNNNRR